MGAPLCKRDPIGATSVNHDAIKLMLENLSMDQWVIMPTTTSAYGTGDENNFCTARIGSIQSPNMQKKK